MSMCYLLPIYNYHRHSMLVHGLILFITMNRWEQEDIHTSFTPFGSAGNEAWYFILNQISKNKNTLLHAGVSFITSKLVVIGSQWSNRYRYIDDGDWCFPNMLFVYLAHMYVLNPLYQNDMTCPVRGVCRATFNVLLLRGSKCSCHCNTRDMCAIPFPMLLRCLTNWTV